MITSHSTLRAYLKDHPLKTKAERGAKRVGVVWGRGPEAGEARIRGADRGLGQVGHPVPSGVGAVSQWSLRAPSVFPTWALEGQGTVMDLTQAPNPVQPHWHRRVLCNWTGVYSQQGDGASDSRATRCWAVSQSRQQV